MISSNKIIDMEETGLNLKHYAELNGLSALKIQKYLGLSCPQPVYRWYKGKTLPSLDHIMRLADLFHVTMDELIIRNSPALVYNDKWKCRYWHTGFEKRMLFYAMYMDK